MANREPSRARQPARQGSPRRRKAAGPRPPRFIRRRLKRLYRRHPQAKPIVRVASVSLCLLAVAGLAAWGILSALPGPADRARPVAEVAAPPLTAIPTAAPTQAPTPEPTPEPTPDLSPWLQTAAPGADYADPASNQLLKDTEALWESAPGSDDIHMKGSDSYATLEGVTTFRGSHYRDGGAWGTIPDNPTRLTGVWEKKIHSLDEWSGVGWTGQASLVRWPEALRRRMNIKPEKRNVDDLVEVIYATLDGHIYFLDMEDGAKTREAIDIDAPITPRWTVTSTSWTWRTARRRGRPSTSTHPSRAA